MSTPPPIDSREHFDWVADHDSGPRRAQRGFHAQLLRQYRHHIPEGSRVLECGCGAGDLLAGLEPSRGLGVDFSPRMLGKAQARHGDRPELEFRELDATNGVGDEKFDHIVLDYLTGYLGDIQATLQNLHASAHERTRLHITTLNTLWLLPLKTAVNLGAVMPQAPSNWLSHHDLFNLLELSGWEVVSFERLQLFPFDWPGLAPLLNNVVVRLPGFRVFGITLWITARPRRRLIPESPISCSVIIPARNESGNIRAAIERVPVLGRRTEIVFVEGNSRDDTWAVIQREVAAYNGPHLVRAIQQPGRGKWDAVSSGFEIAQGEVLVIQDADLTAPPEDLAKFYEALMAGAAEFVNGSRLVYPMEAKAMRFLNLLGNKFFALALSYVLGQPVKDSLCGTKMIRRADYERLLRRIADLGDFDPFGDFNLLFGAALLDLKIRDLPVRYKDRTYGTTNISRFSHGWLLLRMTWFALWRLKFHR
ncbi:MAG TPA: glycosyltransferase [Candidatus Didemnitutus sp.]|nr:glycosyltransferase [Candidatus Didemnitutus sp.]